MWMIIVADKEATEGREKDDINDTEDDREAFAGSCTRAGRDLCGRRCHQVTQQTRIWVREVKNRTNYVLKVIFVLELSCVEKGNCRRILTSWGKRIPVIPVKIPVLDIVPRVKFRFEGILSIIEIKYS